MIIIRNIIIISLALLVQSTVFGHFSFFGAKPDIALLVIILLASNSGQSISVLYGFFTGFIQDVYTPEFLGVNSLIMSIIAFLISTLKERLTVENYSVKTIVCFIACIIHDLIYLFFYTGFDYSAVFSLFWRISLLGALYTSIIIMVIVRLWDIAVNGGAGFVISRFLGIRRSTL
jgi:rod shape-determining protein MreD